MRMWNPCLSLALLARAVLAAAGAAAWATDAPSAPGIASIEPAPVNSLTPDATMGLAARYPGDAGLAGDPDVLFVWDYENPKSWRSGWVGKLKLYEHTSNPDEVFRGRGAIAARLVGGKGGGGDHHRLKGGEPVVYQRFYVKFTEGFDTGRGYKFHGLAGTGPGKPSWFPQGSAGRRPTGEDKLYGILTLRPQAKSASRGTGFYFYHMDQRGGYGDGRRFAPGLARNQWICYEMMIKANDVGQKNGELKCWIDGKLAQEVTGLRWRTSEKLAVNLVLDHVYVNDKVVKDQAVFFDNRVIARKYIGPMRQKPVARKRSAKSFVFKPRTKPVAPPVLAAYEALLQEAGELEKKGDFEGAATAVGKLVESAKSDDEREALSFIQQAIAGAAGLRARVIKTVQGGKRARVYVDVGMGKTRATTIGADGSALKVQAKGATIAVPWRTISPKDFLGIAGRVLKDGKASDYLAIASYAVHIGLSEKAQLAITRALELDPSVKKEAARISARLKKS